MADAYLVRLAREELVYSLHALSLATIPGLVGPPLGHLNAEQQGLVLSVADRTLRARGLVQGHAVEQRTFDPTLGALLQSYSRPQFTFVLALSRPDMPLANSILVFADKLAIEQWQGEAGVHQFLALGTAPDVLALFGRHLDLLPDLPVPTGRATLTAAELRTARQGGNGMRGLPDNLAAALAQPIFGMEGSLWPGRPDGKAAQTVGLVAGTTGIWWFTGLDPLDFTPTTRADVIQRLAALLQAPLSQLAAPQAAA